MFAVPKFQFDCSNVCSRPKLPKQPKSVTFCIVAFKYIKMFSTSDQMFQKSCLGSIEVDWMAQGLWNGLEKNLFGLKNG
jgi:hypothetical protein